MYKKTALLPPILPPFGRTSKELEQARKQTKPMQKYITYESTKHNRVHYQDIRNTINEVLIQYRILTSRIQKPYQRSNSARRPCEHFFLDNGL